MNLKDSRMHFKHFRRIVILCATIVISLSFNPFPASAQEKKQADDSTHSIPKGVVEKLGDVLTFKEKGDRLEPVVCTGMQDANIAFGAMGAQMSGGGGGSESQWYFNRCSDQWAISARKGMANEFGAVRGEDSEPKFKLDFVGKSDHGRRLSIISDDRAQIQVWDFNKGNAEFFGFFQSSDGSLFVVSVKPNQIVSAFEANFSKLLKSKPQIANDVLLLELRKWGITKLGGRFSSEVRDLLLLQFATPDNEAQNNFDRNVSELSASVFETREQASDWLSKNAKANSGILISAMLNPELPPESRARIRKVLEATLGDTKFETFCQIEKQKINDDPELLIWLLGETKIENTQSNIVEKLQAITGESFGNDIQAWKDWLVKSGKQTMALAAAEPIGAPDSYPTLEGTLLDVASIVTDLVPLAVTDGKIQLDRNRWERLYGGKSVEQLGQEFRQYAIDRHLPADWVNLGDNSLKGLEHVHLIFPQLEAKTKPDDKDENAERIRLIRNSRMRFSENPANPNVQTEKLSGSLEVDEGGHISSHVSSRSPKRPAETFVLTLVDKKNPANSLIFGSWPGGIMRIIVTGPTSLVQIFQSADGKCSLDCAVENKSLHREFESADQLLSDPHFVEKVAVLLRQYGLQFQPATMKTSELP